MKMSAVATAAAVVVLVVAVVDVIAVLASVFCVVVCFIGFHASIFNHTPDCVCVRAYGANSAIFRFFPFLCVNLAMSSKVDDDVDHGCKMHYSRLSIQCAHNNMPAERTA